MGTATNRQLAVVTGASSGIGLELAKCAIENGFDVLIAAENDSIHTVAAELRRDGVMIASEQVDLATYEGVEQLYQAVHGLGREVDVLLLNAGVGVGGEFVKTSLEEELKLIALNCTSVVHLAKRVAKDMVARGHGRIMITSSIVGTAPAPYEAVYGASKAFDLSFAEALHYELKDAGITVTAVQPGATDTQFFERAGLENTKVGQAEKDDPADVAKRAWDGMMDGKDKVLAGGFKARMQGRANEVLPEQTKAKAHAKQAEPKH